MAAHWSTRSRARPVPDTLIATFAEHAHEHPLITRFAQTSDTRPLSPLRRARAPGVPWAAVLRDVLSRARDRVPDDAFVVKVSSTSHAAIVLSRGTRDYTDAERLLLDRAGPDLVQISRNAIAHTDAHTQQQPTEAALAGSSRSCRADAGPDSRTRTRRARAVERRRADALAISGSDVGSTWQRCYRKLDAANRSQAATRVWAICDGLTSPPSNETSP